MGICRLDKILVLEEGEFHANKNNLIFRTLRVQVFVGRKNIVLSGRLDYVG